MTHAIHFDPIRLPEAAQALRRAVREFLRGEIAGGTFDPSGGATSVAFDAGFSRRVGARGWIGMTWPKQYGGGERSFLERYVVTEEFRVANAPVGLHFTADRQSGPILLRYASERIKADILPRITRGECCFCIGMSEPGSGSDLFAASTRAVRCDGGWRVTGTKVWTTGAHRADYMIGLFRTSPRTAEDRRHGLTQFLVDMRTPGIAVHPISDMSGRREFDEVVFDDAFMPDEHVLGEIDLAWKQATSELAYERSGPERFLETSYVLFALVRLLAEDASTPNFARELPTGAVLGGAGPREPPRSIDARSTEGVGRLVAQLHALRRMSVSVAGMLEAGQEPTLEGSIVKDLGTVWQQTLPPRARDLAAFVDPAIDRAAFDALLDYATLAAPKLTIQGGTTEILRGIIARGLGLR
jgi:acyl-CoA dehydrogenase